ncbi:hypothetical protein DH2020_028971 [Rehmannia glutinosa]|uniref:F-box domain-containing protein n=1 Tax=Rehmannia glutinosa TaxID=99300 RepID=A0ABR0VT85_REHGL
MGYWACGLPWERYPEEGNSIVGLRSFDDVIDRFTSDKARGLSLSPSARVFVVGLRRLSYLSNYSSAMAGDDCVSLKCRVRPYYLRRCKRVTLTNIESLPDDMVFKILLHLPVEDIYNVAKFVCRKWYHIINSHNFIYTHLQHSSGLLIQHLGAFSSSPIFVSMSRGQIEISKLSYKFRDIVWTSCNGLLLERTLKYGSILYVSNPVTKQHFALPPLNRRVFLNTYSGLGYDAASREYKVVHTYVCNDYNDGDPNIGCAILTVGVDEYWRNVQTEHLCVSASEFCWEVWEMKPDTAEWIKLLNIDLEARKCTLEHLFCFALPTMFVLEKLSHLS